MVVAWRGRWRRRLLGVGGAGFAGSDAGGPARVGRKEDKVEAVMMRLVGREGNRGVSRTATIEEGRRLMLDLLPTEEGFGERRQMGRAGSKRELLVLWS